MNTQPEFHPSQLPQLEVRKFHHHKVKWPCTIQPKMDGINARYYNGKLYTRDNKVWEDHIVEHIVSELQGLFPSEIVVHGELWNPDMSLDEIASAISVKRLLLTPESKLINYYPYDFSFVDPKKNHSLPYEERHQILRQTIPGLWKDNVKLPPDYYYISKLQREADGIAEDLHLLKGCKGYDGVILRDCRGYIYKLKRNEDEEFLCVGLKEGLGKYRGMMGALLLKTKSGEEFEVGTGFTDRQRDFMWSRQYYYTGKKILVKYRMLSKKKQIPIEPVFLAVRDYE